MAGRSIGKAWQREKGTGDALCRKLACCLCLCVLAISNRCQKNKFLLPMRGLMTNRSPPQVTSRLRDRLTLLSPHPRWTSAPSHQTRRPKFGPSAPILDLAGFNPPFLLTCTYFSSFDVVFYSKSRLFGYAQKRLPRH
jgi:hypothetical protein